MALLNKDWLSDLSLMDLYFGNDYGSSFTLVYLRNILKQFSSQMPNDIKRDTNIMGTTEFYVRKSSVDKFFTLSKLKTRDWLDTQQIWLDLVFDLSQKTISDTLKRLQSQMPDDIQPKLLPNGKTELCLHKSAMNKFVELANIQTTEWKSAHEIHRLAPLSASYNEIYINRLLHSLAPLMPDDIQPKLTFDGTTELCLRKTAMDKFVELANEQTAEWKNAHEIHRLYPLRTPYNEIYINRLLRNLAPLMPNDIQPRLTHDGETELCVRTTAIDNIIDMLDNSSSEWLDSSQIRYGAYTYKLPSEFSRDVIPSKLKELQPKMPHDILPKITDTGNIELHLRRTAFDKFEKLANLQSRDWLTDADLKNGSYAYGTLSSFSQDVIAGKLKELQSKMPDDIQPKLLPNGKTELCLREKAIYSFMELANLHNYNWFLPQELGYRHKATIPTSLIADKFKELQPKMPHDIQPKLLPNGQTELCLRESAINKFLELSKIPTSDWILPRELERTTGVKTSVIADKFKELQSQMSDDIQSKVAANGKTELYLRETAQDKFLELADIQTDDWVTVRGLKYGPYNIPSSFSLDVIADKLKDLQSKMPNDIKMKYTHHSTQELCLRTSQVSIFITNLFKSGSQTKDFATKITDDQMDEIASRLATQQIATTNADNVLLAELHNAAKSNQEPKRKKSVFDHGASAVSTLTEVNDIKQKINRRKTKQHTESK